MCRILEKLQRMVDRLIDDNDEYLNGLVDGLMISIRLIKEELKCKK